MTEKHIAKPTQSPRQSTPWTWIVAVIIALALGAAGIAWVTSTSNTRTNEPVTTPESSPNNSGKSSDSQPPCTKGSCSEETVTPVQD